MKLFNLVFAGLAVTGSSASAAVLPAGVKPALESEHIGLLDADKLKLTNGACSDCASSPQSLWYFRNDLIAAPTLPDQVAGVSPRLDRRRDITAWSLTPEAATLRYPALTWIGAPQILHSAHMQQDGTMVLPDGGTPMAFGLVPKLATNRSYANAATMSFFGSRALRIRGTLEETAGQPRFIARTIWPADFAIDASSLTAQPLKAAVDLYQSMRVQPLPGESKPASRLLWERTPGAARALGGKPVIGIVLNGAQGDDDESLGGHFAVATGRFGPRGEWADWAANNFYNLDSVSEKGIIAATLPMDNYLMDLNSGQQYYRPSTMLVAVLNKARTAVAYQGGVQRTLNHFYRHDMLYEQAANNCAGLSIDVFRALGWHIPERGATGKLKAVAAYGYVAVKEGSLKKGRSIYDYLTEETTRLLPAVAFDAATLDLLRLVGAMPAIPRVLSPYEQQLKDDVDAIILVTIPQVPSSRVAGSAPAFSFDDYMSRVPSDQARWQIVPVAPRPFPAELRDSGTPLAAPPSVVPAPVAGLGLAGLLGGGAWWRRRKKIAQASSNTDRG